MEAARGEVMGRQCGEGKAMDGWRGDSTIGRETGHGGVNQCEEGGGIVMGLEAARG